MKARQTQKQNITKPLSSFLGWWELVTKLWQMDLNPNNLSSVLNYFAQIMTASLPCLSLYYYSHFSRAPGQPLKPLKS